MKEHFYNLGVQYQRSNDSHQQDLWGSSSWQRYYWCIQRTQWTYSNSIIAGEPILWLSKQLIRRGTLLYKSGWIHLHILHLKMVHQLLTVHGIGCCSNKTHSSPSFRRYNWWRDVYRSHSSNLIILAHLFEQSIYWDNASTFLVLGWIPCKQDFTK